MAERADKDFTLRLVKKLWILAGAYFTENRRDERNRYISLSNLVILGCWAIYVSKEHIKHFWGVDMGYCFYSFSNVLMVFQAVSRVFVLYFRRHYLKDLIEFVDKHIWNSDYTPEEQAYTRIYWMLCKLWCIFGITMAVLITVGYAAVPLGKNRGRNGTQRELLFAVWINLPIYETPYYEMVFVYQVLNVMLTGIAYITPDSYMIIFHIHVICQFRILQRRILDFWQLKKEDTDDDMALERYTVAFKKCIQRHQILIELCDKLERVFSPVILTHFAVFSVFMALDGYEMLLPETRFERRATVCLHGGSSFIHLLVLAYSCDGIMEESTNIITTMYRGSWTTMPMNQKGRTLRLDMRMVMMKGLRPCCMTAGGFFPVSLETFTSLARTAFSYFALMRESLAYDNK